MLGTIPRGVPVVQLPFKVFRNRQAKRSSRALQNLVCGSLDPHPIPPPESIGTVCMFSTLRQKRYSFNCALSLWRGLNGAAHCCGNNKIKGERKKNAKGVFAASESSAYRSDQATAGISQKLSFHVLLTVSVTGRGKPLDSSGSTGTEERTKLLRKEGGLQRILSHKEMISKWDANPMAALSLEQLSNRSVKVILWKYLRPL